MGDSPLLFAVTDIETTGGQPGGNSIIELGICLIENNVVIEKYHSLFRPEKKIPRFITGLTGISDEMLADAPQFGDEAKKIFEILNDAVFVAHNVNFDFAFIQNAFDLQNIQWNPKRLCSLRLARKAFPGLRSYSLGALANHLGIHQYEAHRALSDAETATQILIKSIDVIGSTQLEKLIRQPTPEVFLPPGLELKIFENLPQSPGVYYMRDIKGSILYIGKAINIKSRVQQHFTQYLDTSRAQNFMRQVTDITYELAGNNLMACILEDVAIRTHMPKFNRAQRQIPIQIHISRYRDQRGRIRLLLSQGPKTADSLLSFVSKKGARNWLFRFCQEFNISPKMVGLDLFEETYDTAREHNEKITSALAIALARKEVIVFQGQGREDGEYSYILCEPNESYWVGFSRESFRSMDELKSQLQQIPSSTVIKGHVREASENELCAKRIYF